MKNMTEYTYFPRNAVLSKFQDMLDKTFWTAEEISYDEDKIQMIALQLIAISGKEEKVGAAKITFSPEQAKYIISFVKTILCLFAQLDGVVIENLLDNFTEEISAGEKEIKDFYISQSHNELMHSKSYATQVEKLIDSEEERMEIYTASLKYPAVDKIKQWTLTWFDRDLPIVDRLIAFCCIEGVVFTSGFVAIYRLKEWGLFINGLCKANEMISKDEAVHTAAGIGFFHHKLELANEMSKLQTSQQVQMVETKVKGTRVFSASDTKVWTRPSQERVYEIVQAAVDLAFEFTDDAVRPELIGLERDDMKAYIMISADLVLKDLGYETKYNVPKCPFPWMEKICLFNIGNFFETRVTEYQRQTGEEAEVVKWDDDDGKYRTRVVHDFSEPTPLV